MKGNSVSQRIFFGSKTTTDWSSNASGELQIFSNDEFKSLFGREFDAGSGDMVIVMNGDWYANAQYFSCTGYYTPSKSIWTKTWSGAGSGKIRINYLVVLSY